MFQVSRWYASSLPIVSCCPIVQQIVRAFGSHVAIRKASDRHQEAKAYLPLLNAGNRQNMSDSISIRYSLFGRPQVCRPAGTA